MDENDTFRPVTDDLAKKALETILDRNQHPVLVLCKTGVHQTGTVIACLRRMMDWGLTATLDEVMNACSCWWMQLACQLG